MNLKKMLLAVLVVLPVAGFAEEGSDTNVVWTRSIGLGATYKDGNSEKTLYTLNLKGDRTTPITDFINSLYAEYGKTGTPTAQKEQTEGQVLGKSEYRYKFGNERVYASVNGEVLHDALKNISYRAGVGPNIGYYFIKNATMKLDFSMGLNYVGERVAGVEDTYGAYRAAGRYNWNINANAELYSTVEYTAQVDDTDNGNGLFVLGLKSKVNNALALSIELRDEYANMPAFEVAHNDVTLIAGLSYDF